MKSPHDHPTYLWVDTGPLPGGLSELVHHSILHSKGGVVGVRYVLRH